MSNDDQQVSLYFTGPIDEQVCQNIRDACIKAVQGGVSLVRLEIASDGGMNGPARWLSNFLGSLPVRLTAHNLGVVRSAAVPVFLAAAYRTADPLSRFVIHPLVWFPPSISEIPHYMLKEWVASLDNDLEWYVQTFAQATQGAVEPLDVRTALTGAPIVLDAESALRAGIVHKIERVQPSAVSGH